MHAPFQIMIFAGILQLVLMLAHGTYVSLAFGLKWGLGRRDTPRVPSDLGRRIERTLVNNTEHMIVFLPVLMAVALARPEDVIAQNAAVGFVATRVVFAALYYGNVPYLRTVAWFVGHGFILTMVRRLLAA